MRVIKKEISGKCENINSRLRYINIVYDLIKRDWLHLQSMNSCNCSGIVQTK